MDGSASRDSSFMTSANTTPDRLVDDRRSPVFREYMYLSPRIDDDPVVLASGTVRTTGRGHER
ncbi:hypothetical protein BRC68_11500 [Halobacteriales archaeon QH_6_64_20]|nr:MAG: hypothetical protein BRC68_11500 [Halobacteriales archaeon QH_6_64_20]